MEFRPGMHMGPQPPVGSLQQRIMSPRLRAQQEVLSHHMPQRKLSHKADEILEKLGYMRGGRVTRKMAALVDDVADMSRERLVERRAMLELVGRPDPGREAMFWGGRQSAGESPPVKSLEEILLDADAASRRAERRKEILSKLGLSKMDANISEKGDKILIMFIQYTSEFFKELIVKNSFSPSNAHNGTTTRIY